MAKSMPKLKTHRGAAKRFKKTGTGKFVRGSAFKRHILTSKTRARKRKLRGTQARGRRRPGEAAEDDAELSCRLSANQFADIQRVF